MLHLLNVNVVTIFKKCNHTVVEKGKHIFENVFFFCLNLIQLYFGNKKFYSLPREQTVKPYFIYVQFHDTFAKQE